MPIRPENRDRYPPDWKEISERIRFARAGGRCECTGQCGADHAEEYEAGYTPDQTSRCQAEHGWRHPITGSKVVLTVAHLDHMPENNADDNLLAMCQRCHNRYDAPHRRANIRRARRAQKAVGDLFGD